MNRSRDNTQNHDFIYISNGGTSEQQEGCIPLMLKVALWSALTSKKSYTWMEELMWWLA